MTQIGCEMHKRGVRVVLAGFGGLNESRLDSSPSDTEYIREFVHKRVKGARETPWVDGWQLDLEHFPRKGFHPAALTKMVCDIQAGLWVPSLLYVCCVMNMLILPAHA